MIKKGAALNPNGYPHHTEHLAPVAVLMGIPLLFSDELTAESARKLYPALQVEVIDWDLFDPKYLAHHYDVLYTSDQWPRDKFFETFKPYNEGMRHVHCPHGYSDKAFWLSQCAFEDIPLIYGQNMIDMMERENVLSFLKDYVVTGNLRYQYYQDHRQFFDTIYEEQVGSRFEKRQKTLLYAPTWQDAEHSYSFFSAIITLIDNLPSTFNLIIKLHPNLEENDIVEVYRIMGICESMKNVLILKDFPLVYPLLSHVDAYIGDRSSIGYDYLAFDRPLFFLDETQRDPTKEYLYRCGRVITPNEYPLIYNIIQESPDIYSQIRKEAYNYTFTPHRQWDQVRGEIHQMCGSFL